MARVKFYLKNNPAQSKQIVAHIFIAKQQPRLYYFTEAAIQPQQWDYKKQRARTKGTDKAPGAVALNSYLDSLENEILTHIYEIKRNEPLSSYQSTKDSLLIKLNRVQEKTFFQYYEDFLKTGLSQVTKNTNNLRITLKNVLILYSETKKQPIQFSSINRLFWENFYNYLTIDRKLRSSTCKQYMTLLKGFMNWSFERGLHENLEYKKFKLSVPTKEIIYLEPEELQRLIDLDLTENNILDQVRDLFLFGCFTGARYSDLSTMNREDIQNNIWHLRTHKTKDSLRIPLNNIALSILDKYSNTPAPLPVVIIQYAINHIKEVCKLAGIDTPVKTTKYIGTQRIDETKPKYKLMGTHTARRTFVTLSIMQGMKPETVMKITGHSDYKTMQKYLNITNKEAHKEYFKAWGNPNLSLVENQ